MTNLRPTMQIQFRKPPFQSTQRTLITEKEITIQEISLAYPCRFIRKYNIKSPKEHNLESKSWETQTLLGHYIIIPIKQKVNRANTLLRNKSTFCTKRATWWAHQKSTTAAPPIFSIIQENHFAELPKNPKFLKFLSFSSQISLYFAPLTEVWNWFKNNSRMRQVGNFNIFIWMHYSTVISFDAQVWMEEIFC